MLSRLAQIEKLLASDPATAEAQAAELQVRVPGHPQAMLLQGIALRLMRNPAAAIEILTALSTNYPDAPMVHLQLGLALRETGDDTAAAGSMRRAVAVQSDFCDAWLALGDLLAASGDADAANAAFMEYIRYSANDPRLHKPAAALRENRLPEADYLLRRLLAAHPADIVAMCMLGEVSARQEKVSDAETLLTRCLELAPGYLRARHNYALLLLRRNKARKALQESDRLLELEPENPDFRKFRAVVHLRMRDYDDAIMIYQALLAEYSEEPEVWTSLGHAMRVVGRRDECINAYRRAIDVAPDYGEAYWSLANLKNVRFSGADMEAMQTRVAAPGLAEEDRIHFHFAIGKALEDQGEYAESFRHYDQGNRLRRKRISYDASALTEHVRRSIAVLTPDFLAARQTWGTHAPDPIFIVGLPRTGSTLVEQILASHSAVEGTTELPEIMSMAKSLDDWNPDSAGPKYPEVLEKMQQVVFQELGEAYIEQTRVQRKLDTPFFIDKMPNNLAHIGLIHLIMPNARIIDVRRHPIATGWSLFKQLFARHQDFSYDLAEIAQYYRDYVQLMSHFDTVLPGRVHRVIYEALVNDPETEVRRLLEYCKLSFEAACLDFHRNARAVSTASSEQVRSPIYRSAIDHWRHYEPWLGPLKDSLGGLVDAYPGTPVFPDTGADSALESHIPPL